ncbi:uncharacterized protein DS421_6g171710 [Arachis hypogaea]|nr:uncharacterized protein DS421_6g171710 [Arachis hypogaea]
MKRYRTTDFKISVLNSSFQRILLFFLEALRMPERLSSTLDQHLVCPIVTPSPTFVQRDGNLSVLEEEGIAKASEFEFWSSKMEDFPFYHVTVLYCFPFCVVKTVHFSSVFLPSKGKKDWNSLNNFGLSLLF